MVVVGEAVDVVVSVVEVEVLVVSDAVVDVRGVVVVVVVVVL